MIKALLYRITFWKPATDPHDVTLFINAEEHILICMTADSDKKIWIRYKDDRSSATDFST